VSNDYAVEPITSEDATSLMRRINALEAASSAVPTGFRLAVDSTFIYVISREATRISKFFRASFVLDSRWPVPAFPPTPVTGGGISGYGYMGTDGTHLYISTYLIAANTESQGAVYKYTMDGDLVATFDIPGVTQVAVSDGVLYLARVPVMGTTFSSVTIEQRTLTGDLNWATSLAVAFGFNMIFSKFAVFGGLTYLVTERTVKGLPVARVIDISGDILPGHITFPSNHIGRRIYAATSSTLYVESGAFGAYGMSTVSLNGVIGISQNAYTYQRDVVLDGAFLYDVHVSGFALTSLVGVYGATLLDKVSRNEVDMGTIPETTWHGYTLDKGSSLGVPDGGVSVPADNALFDQPDAIFSVRNLLDMRETIERVAPEYKNAATGNPFNFTDQSADNLYFVAMGDRTKYGAVGGARYDWTRTESALERSDAYYIDIGEILETVVELEGSALVP